ncbi:MAG: helix-turn-helix domain-containing protein [Burkholderiaceae bacterium]
MTTERISTAEALVAARESRGLSTEDIQRQLKLHPRQVHAIETGDWAALPGLSFIRGTVRNYGKIVGVDVEPLLESISGTTKAAELRSAASLDEPLRPGGMMGFGNGGSGSRWIWALVVLAALIALVLFFGRDADLSKVPSFFGGQGSSESSTSGTASDGGGRVETVPITPSLGGGASAPASGAAMAPAPAAGDSAAVPIPQPLLPAPATPAPEATTLAPAASAATPAAPAGPLLKLSFDADAWIEIRQRSDNKVLTMGTQKAKTTLELPIAAPVSVTLGNAEKIKAEFDGKSLGLKVQPGTGIARLTLP